MGLLARDIMNSDVISVPTTMDLRDLARLFLDKGISGAPVVDPEGALAGVISQTDLVYHSLTRGEELVLDSNFYQSARVEGQHVPKGFQFEDANTGYVRDVMTPVVHSVTEKASAESVARLMMRKHIHRVIVRKGPGVSGIISALDVLRALGPGRSAAKRKAATRKKAKAPVAKAKARGKAKTALRSGSARTAARRKSVAPSGSRAVKRR